jgi:hypothetical protein
MAVNSVPGPATAFGIQNWRVIRNYSSEHMFSPVCKILFLRNRFCAINGWVRAVDMGLWQLLAFLHCPASEIICVCCYCFCVSVIFYTYSVVWWTVDLFSPASNPCSSNRVSTSIISHWTVMFLQVNFRVGIMVRYRLTSCYDSRLAGDMNGGLEWR